MEEIFYLPWKAVQYISSNACRCEKITGNIGPSSVKMPLLSMRWRVKRSTYVIHH